MISLRVVFAANLHELPATCHRVASLHTSDDLVPVA